MEYIVKYVKYPRSYPEVARSCPEVARSCLEVARSCPEVVSKWGRNDQHFLKKPFSYESSGQTPKLKSFVYGSSNHDLFKKKVDSIGKLHSDSRILVGTLFFI